MAKAPPRDPKYRHLQAEKPAPSSGSPVAITISENTAAQRAMSDTIG